MEWRRVYDNQRGERGGVRKRRVSEEGVEDVSVAMLVRIKFVQMRACARTQGRTAPNSDAVNLPLLLSW